MAAIILNFGADADGSQHVSEGGPKGSIEEQN